MIMGLHAKRISIALLVVFVAIYSMEHIIIRERWEAMVVLGLTFYVLMLLISVLIYRKQKRAIEKERLLDELLSDDNTG